MCMLWRAAGGLLRPAFVARVQSVREPLCPSLVFVLLFELTCLLLEVWAGVWVVVGVLCCAFPCVLCVCVSCLCVV